MTRKENFGLSYTIEIIQNLTGNGGNIFSAGHLCTLTGHCFSGVVAGDCGTDTNQTDPWRICRKHFSVLFGAEWSLTVFFIAFANQKASTCFILSKSWHEEKYFGQKNTFPSC